MKNLGKKTIDTSKANHISKKLDKKTINMLKVSRTSKDDASINSKRTNFSVITEDLDDF